MNSDVLKILVFVLVFTWYPLYPSRGIHSSAVADPDVWWHMRAGEWILQHHALPRVDPFSITSMGKPWVDYSWSFDILIYKIAQIWDLVGLVAFTTIMWVAVTAALYYLIRSLGRNFWASLALTFAGSLTMLRAFTPRPGVFSVLFFILVLHTLLSAQRTGKTTKLWMLAAILLVWANVHVQFVYGLFVIGVFAVEPFLNRLFYHEAPDSWRRNPGWTVWPVLLVSSAATLLNPYGTGVYRVLWDFLRQPQLRTLVIETQAMAFDNFMDYLALALALFAAFALGRQPRVRPLWVVLLVWAAYSAFHAQRDVWLLAIVAVAIIAATPMPSLAESTELNQQRKLIAVACVIVVLLAGFIWLTPSNKELLSSVALVYPLGSVAYIHEHKLTGPMFNDFNWGGFLIYAVPEIPVSIDGRTNVHGQDGIVQSNGTWNLRPGWQSNPQLWAAKLIIANPSTALSQVLYRDPRFSVAFSDRVSVLFVRNESRSR